MLLKLKYFIETKSKLTVLRHISRIHQKYAYNLFLSRYGATSWRVQKSFT